MTSTVLDLGVPDTKTKRFYSKGGCRECKRRKIKCDEAKPSCWQCARLRKECTYPAFGEKVARIGKRQISRRNSSDKVSKLITEAAKPPTRTPLPNQVPGLIKVEPLLQPNQPVDFRKDGSLKTIPLIYNTSSQVVNSPIKPLPQPAVNPYLQAQPVGIQLHSGQPQRARTPIRQAQNQDALNKPYQVYHRQNIPPVNLPHHTTPPPIPLHPTPSHVIPLQNIPFHPSHSTIHHQNNQNMPQQNSRHQQHNMALQENIPQNPNLPHHLSQKSNDVQHSNMPQESNMSQHHNLHLNQNIPQPRPILHNPSINNLLNENDSTALQSNNLSNMPFMKYQNTKLNSQTPIQSGTLDNTLFDFFDQNDLHVLAADLNSMVNSIMYETSYDKLHESSSETSSVMNLHIHSPITNSSIASSPQQPNMKLPFEYSKLVSPSEKAYLEEFYEEFSSIILPLNSWDPQAKTYSNPARDIILSVAANESCLLAAVLAHGAKALFRRSKLPADEQAYCLYLAKCLELLGPALTSEDPRCKSKGDLASSLEAMLLTVLILTAANASNSLQNWRPHLTGAKDLLRKYSNHKNSSDVLIFCKCWFVCLEVLAGISSRLGGTILSDVELDLILSFNDHEISVLKKYGVILENGFSVMFGFHYDCLDQFRDLIKLLNKKRVFKSSNPSKKYLPEQSFEYLRLLSAFYQQSQVEFIDKKGVISANDFNSDKRYIGNLVNCIPSSEIVISWQDTSHQAYVLAAIITILTDFFHETNTSVQVQFLTKRIIFLIEYLAKDPNASRSLMKCSLIMLLWPMYVAGINCITEDSKAPLIKFFRYSALMGSGGAKFALKRICKTWKKDPNDGSGPDEDDDGLVDLVSY